MGGNGLKTKQQTKIVSYGILWHDFVCIQVILNISSLILDDCRLPFDYFSDYHFYFCLYILRKFLFFRVFSEVCDV